MRARIIFFACTAAAAAAASTLTGLAVVVAGLVARMPAGDLIAVTAATVTATFAAVVALAAVAASLFFSQSPSPDPPGLKASPRQRRDRSSSKA